MIRHTKTANAHWSQASTLIGYFVKEKNLSYRSGHQVLAHLMRTVADGRFAVSDVTPEMVEAAAEKYLGRRLGVTQDVLNRVFDARYCVEQRHYRGGTAPVRAREHIEAARRNLAADRADVETISRRVRTSRELLDNAFLKAQEQYA